VSRNAWKGGQRAKARLLAREFSLVLTRLQSINAEILK